MSITSANPTSRRGYVSKKETAELLGVAENAIVDEKLGRAEEMIDAYVGYQIKFFQSNMTGRASAGGSNTLDLQTDQQNLYEVDYFKGCEIEILGGTAIGDRKKIIGSTKEGRLTVDSAWSATPDTTTFYSIYQLGKFPRQQDVVFYSQNAPYTYYKRIPEAIKRATVMQYEFIISMGDDFFAGDQLGKESESIGDYSYTNATESTGVQGLIAPKVKLLLKGIRNRTAKLIV